MAVELCDTRIGRLVLLGELDVQVAARLWAPLRAILSTQVFLHECFEARAAAVAALPSPPPPPTAAAAAEAVQTEGAGASGRAPRVVRFSSFDASHLAPPCDHDWRGAPAEDANARQSEHDEAVERLFTLVAQQLEWRGGSAHDEAGRQALLRLLRRAVESSCGQPIALGGSPAAPPLAPPKALAVRRFLSAELRCLEQGGAMLQRRLGELLRASIRQQLRRLLEIDGCGATRGTALVAALPHSRGVGFLRDVDSAARVLSNALYEYHRLREAALEPRLREVLQRAQRREAAAVVEVREMPAATRELLLTYAEAHAVLRRLLPLLQSSQPAGLPPATHEDEWGRLQQLLGMVHAARCDDEALFLPLARLGAMERQLDAELRHAIAIQWGLEWQPAVPPPAERRSISTDALFDF